LSHWYSCAAHIQKRIFFSFFFKYEIWALPWLRQSPACQYGTLALCMGFVGDKVTNGIGFPLSTLDLLCQYHSTSARYSLIHLGQYTANPCCWQGLHSLKIPETVKVPCGNLIPCGKNGFRGTRAK
jgi:hypothetical protein